MPWQVMCQGPRPRRSIPLEQYRLKLVRRSVGMAGQNRELKNVRRIYRQRPFFGEDGYVSNMPYEKCAGFTGRKALHFNSRTFRFVSKGKARTAELQTGELQVLEVLNVPAAKRLRTM